MSNLMFIPPQFMAREIKMYRFEYENRTGVYSNSDENYLVFRHVIDNHSKKHNPAPGEDEKLKDLFGEGLFAHSLQIYKFGFESLEQAFKWFDSYETIELFEAHKVRCCQYQGNGFISRHQAVMKINTMHNLSSVSPLEALEQYTRK